MTMFGLEESEVSVLIRAGAGAGAGAGADLDRDAILDRFARATWTGLAEPGDRTAGLVVDTLGATVALDGVVADWRLANWTAALERAGFDDLPVAELAGEIVTATARWKPRLNSGQAMTALRQAARYSVKLLIPGAPGWPDGLAGLGMHAPIALWVRGTDAGLAALAQSIALVGARAATGYGEHVAMEAAAGLVDRGFAIVSGAAYGIDGMAHRAALASKGMTVAFLAGGVDRFYPSGHDTLLTRIVADGAVVSELPCGQPPTKWRFLQRNRLIAAASQATVVLEAGWRSGSLNTAHHAAQLGRPIGAVPGPVTSAASAGCHRLIQELTATLVTNAAEMAGLLPDALPGDGFGRDAGTTAVAAETGLKPDHVRLFDALSVTAPRTCADIAARAGMSFAEVQALLGGLELDGQVVERDRGWIRKRQEK
jgi:DNA processing protein